MSSQKINKAISNSVLSSMYGLCSRVAVSLSRPLLTIVKIVRRIGRGSISSQHYDELAEITELNQSPIRSPGLEGKRPAIASNAQVFRQCILQGEQQAKCFTLAILLVVFVGLIIAHLV
jgi:hypothetical protein